MEILVYLLLVVAGVVIGIAVGRLSSDRQRIGKVEAERDAATQALADYRQQVTDHFQHTGELFDRITADYRSLYEHLASGATELCDVPRHDVLQSEPERRRLTEPGTEEATEDATGGGAATASVGAAAAAATTDSTPAEADAAAESETETETDAATKQAEETASGMPEAAAPEETKASEEATAPEEATASEEAVAPKPAEATAGDGEAPADDDQPGVRDGDDKPPLSVNGHYRADEGADLDRKPGAP